MEKDFPGRKYSILKYETLFRCFQTTNEMGETTRAAGEHNTIPAEMWKKRIIKNISFF